MKHNQKIIYGGLRRKDHNFNLFYDFDVLIISAERIILSLVLFSQVHQTLSVADKSISESNEKNNESQNLGFQIYRESFISSLVKPFACDYNGPHCMYVTVLCTYEYIYV